MNKAILDIRAGADTDTPEGNLHPMFAKDFGDVRDRVFDTFHPEHVQQMEDDDQFFTNPSGFEEAA